MLKNHFRQFVFLQFLLTLHLASSPLFGQKETEYSDYIQALEGFKKKEFTKVRIHELTQYLQRFPEAANLDEMHFKLATIYHDTDKKVESFFTHLEIIYLYANSAHVATAKDRLRSLLMQDKKFKDLKESVEPLINPTLTETNKEGLFYAFIRDMYNYHFQPAASLLVTACDRFLSQFPASDKSEEVLFWKADLLLQNEQHHLALSEYLKLTYLYKSSLYVIASKLKIAEIFTDRLKMHQNAILTLEEFLLEFPDDPQAAEAQFRMARLIEQKKKKYIEAINVYTAIAKKYPKSVQAVPALFEAARLYEDKFKEYEQAIRVYNEVVRDFKEDDKAPYALTEAARIYEDKLKDPFNASSVYFKVYGLYPASKIAPESLYAAAEINEKKLKNYDRAIMYYRLVVDKYPNEKIAEKASKKLQKLVEKEGEGG
ncbi:MAG: tol-pal system YbgF family protein [bacterium]